MTTEESNSATRGLKDGGVPTIGTFWHVELSAVAGRRGSCAHGQRTFNDRIIDSTSSVDSAALSVRPRDSEVLTELGGVLFVAKSTVELMGADDSKSHEAVSVARDSALELDHQARPHRVAAEVSCHGDQFNPGDWSVDGKAEVSEAEQR